MSIDSKHIFCVAIILELAGVVCDRDNSDRNTFLCRGVVVEQGFSQVHLLTPQNSLAIAGSVLGLLLGEEPLLLFSDSREVS